MATFNRWRRAHSAALHKAKQPWLLVGGNGAGKSTFYQRVLEPFDIPFINAGRPAKLLYPDPTEKHSYKAALLA